MNADGVLVLLIAVGCVLVVGALGTVLLHRLRGRSLGLQVVVIPLVVLAAVTAAVWVDVSVMFLSGHDSGVIALTLLAALPVGIALAAWLGRDVARSAALLVQDARDLGAGRVLGEAGTASAELTAVRAELVAAGLALAQSRRREAATETSRRELVAWVSHDLRTPLAGIRAMAEALEDGVAQDPDRYHKQLQVETDRLTGMVDTLFLLSRLQAGTMPPVRERLPLHDLVSDAVASVAPVAQARGVRVEGGAAPDVVAAVDPTQMSRALANLLTNAVRHTPADGVVTVTAQRRGAGVRLSVQDACGGIPDDDLPRVFDVAWRGDRTRSSRADGGGGGLGLAVTRGIVEAHGGRVAVANRDGGCRFEVDLPAGA